MLPSCIFTCEIATHSCIADQISGQNNISIKISTLAQENTLCTKLAHLKSSSKFALSVLSLGSTTYDLNQLQSDEILQSLSSAKCHKQGWLAEDSHCR